MTKQRIPECCKDCEHKIDRRDCLSCDLMSFKDIVDDSERLKGSYPECPLDKDKGYISW